MISRDTEAVRPGRHSDGTLKSSAFLRQAESRYLENAGTGDTAYYRTHFFHSVT